MAIEYKRNPDGKLVEVNTVTRGENTIGDEKELNAWMDRLQYDPESNGAEIIQVQNYINQLLDLYQEAIAE